MLETLPTINYTQFSRKKARVGLDPYLPLHYYGIVALIFVVVYFILNLPLIAIVFLTVVFLYYSLIVFRKDIFYFEKKNLDKYLKTLIGKGFIDKNTIKLTVGQQ